MIIFIGQEEKGFFAEEVAKSRLKEETVYVPEDAHIASQVNEILSYGNCSYMVFDIEQYHDEAKELAEEIKRLQNTNNAEIVILACGYSMKSEVIMQLKARKVKYFITEATLSEQKDTFEKCINGYYEKNNMSNASPIDVEEEQKKQKEQTFQGKYISVAGSCHRIGTTTQALQIVKYLTLQGYKACYIQMNGSSFWRDIYEWYNCQYVDQEIGLIQFQNTDIYFKKDRLTDVLKMDYDYFVYDYGVYTDTDFNKLSFLEKNIQIFVTGSFPTEMRYTQELLENNFYKDAFFIFSFTAEDEKQEIVKQFEDIGTVLFSEEVKDPFCLTDTRIYEQIIPIKGIMNKVTKKGRTRKKEGKKKHESGRGIKSLLEHHRAL